jgi:hypothetical protein
LRSGSLWSAGIPLGRRTAGRCRLAVGGDCTA